MSTHVAETSLIKHYSRWTKNGRSLKLLVLLLLYVMTQIGIPYVTVFIPLSGARLMLKYSLHAFSENSTALKVTIHLSCNLAAYVCSCTAEFIKLENLLLIRLDVTVRQKMICQII